ncbi:MAG: hypothetical protein PHO56_05245 [Patescibacteria group bacterium]|nr:hypothetical protein [Patescibacteria group bacterium]
MKKALTFITINFFLLLPLLASADTFNGTVVDSVTSAALSGVKVKIAYPPCSTFTDINGIFSLAIFTTQVKKPDEIILNRAGLSGFPEYARIDLLNLSGKTVSLLGRGGSGIRILRVRADNQIYIYKIVNIGFGSSALELEKSNKPLAKMTAANYSISFQKTGYDPVSLSVSGSQSNLNVKLPPTGATANVKINLDSLGTLTVTPIFSNN